MALHVLFLAFATSIGIMVEAVPSPQSTENGNTIPPNPGPTTAQPPNHVPTTVEPGTSDKICDSIVIKENTWHDGWSGHILFSPSGDVDGWEATITFDSYVDKFEAQQGDILLSTSGTSFKIKNKSWNAIPQTLPMKIGILYRFTSGSPAPKVISIKFNDEILCGLVISTASECKTAEGSIGRCVPITSCPHLNTLMQDLQRNEPTPKGSIEILRESVCGHNHGEKELPVCCKPEHLVTSQPDIISQSSTDIIDINTTSSSMVDIDDVPTPGRKCGIKRPECVMSFGCPMLSLGVSEKKQQYFEQLKPQVEAKLGYNVTYFIVDCYTAFMMGGIHYRIQVNIRGNHCIRLQTSDNTRPDKPLMINYGVQDNMPCEEEQAMQLKSDDDDDIDDDDDDDDEDDDSNDWN